MRPTSEPPFETRKPMRRNESKGMAQIIPFLILPHCGRFVKVACCFLQLKVRQEMKHYTTINSFQNNNLTVEKLFNSTTPIQGRLDISIQTSGTIDGVEMGVLSDGTAYLTARGLARLCGVDHGSILDIGAYWSEEFQNNRVTKIKELMYQHGYTIYQNAFIEVSVRGNTVHAYPDTVCIAVLEYYAFEAGRFIKQLAQQNYRLLAGVALRDYIYKSVGYIPRSSNPWDFLIERLKTNVAAVPEGYFSTFKETVELAVALGEVGLYVDDGFVHDISVGKHWSNYWKSKKLADSYGERVKYEHNYPERFRQYLSNPQECNAYPEAALPEFRRWLREIYIGNGKLKSYLCKKIEEQKLDTKLADRAIENFKKTFLPVAYTN